MPPPNLILITTDQQRWDAAGIYGNDVIQTPNMDRLGREGIVFERAYAASPLSVPTRASLVTGYYPMHPRRLPNSQVLDPTNTLPAHLGRNGYRTQAIGKMHFLPMTPPPLNGFDHQILSEEMRGFRFHTDPEKVWLDDYDQHLIEHHLFGWEKPEEIGYNEIKPLINYCPKEHHVTQWCGDQTVQWLENRPSEPFFLWCSFVKPHVPYDAPVHLKDLYDPDLMPKPWRHDGELDRWRFYEDYRRELEFDLYSDRACQLARANYYANITFIDEQIGRILDALVQTGQIGKTIVLFTSDHGDMMGDHGLWFKSLHFEGSVHVPMMLWGPGKIEGGRRADGLASHYDVTQTLLDLGGVQVDPVDRPGMNLLDIAERKVSRDSVVSVWTGFYVCQCDFKYAYYPNGRHEELFDLRSDPHELNDLSRAPSASDKLKQMRETLIRWLRQYGGGHGLNESGELVGRAYVPKDSQPNPNPHSRQPWQSRIPPSVLQAQGEDLSWYWKEHALDHTPLLPGRLRPGHRSEDVSAPGGEVG